MITVAKSQYQCGSQLMKKRSEKVIELLYLGVTLFRSAKDKEIFARYALSSRAMPFAAEECRAGMHSLKM